MKNKPKEIITKELCAYGCGNVAKYQQANGLKICSSHYSRCPVKRKVNSEAIAKKHKNVPGLMTPKTIKGVGSPEWKKANPEEWKRAHENSGKTLSLNIKEGKTKPSFKDKKHTSNTKSKIGDARISYLENHKNNRSQWYEVSGIKVQGTWERDFAIRLNDLNIKWSRPHLKFKGHRRYTPDFYLDDLDIYVEIKGFMRDRDKRKMWLVLDEHNIDLRVVETLKEIHDFSNVKDFDVFKIKYPEDSIDFSKFEDVW